MHKPQNQIFVINLDASTGRWRQSQQQLGNYQFERISAIDGRALNEIQLNRHFDSHLNHLQYHKTLTAGEIACYLSHRKVWSRIIEEKLDYALVLEDDFILNGNLNELFASVHSLQLPWHCIKLTEYPLKRKERSSQSLDAFRLVSYAKVPARTCAQLISYEGAKRLLAASEKFGRPVDIDLQHWWENDLIVYGLKPYIFKPNQTSGSDIDLLFKRHKRETRYISKFYQQLYFYIENQRAIKSDYC